MIKVLNFNKGRILLWLIPLIWLNCNGKKAEINYYPDEFFGKSLSKKMEGDEAKEFVDKLHFQSVAPASNTIGIYQNSAEEESTTIYVSYYRSEAEADSEWQKMTEKISPENSVFRMPEILQFENREIYRCFGMGQTHYVFTNEKELLWISLNTVRAEEMLSEYLDLISR